MTRTNNDLSEPSLACFRVGAFADTHLSPRSKEFEPLLECIRGLNSQLLDFVVQLGGLFGCDNGSLHQPLKTVGLIERPLYNVLANRDFGVLYAEQNSAVERLTPQGGYNSLSPVPSWSCLVLDGAEISLFRYPVDTVSHREAEVRLARLKSENAASAQPCNGANAPRQLGSFRDHLQAADRIPQKLIMFAISPASRLAGRALFGILLLLE